MLRVDPDDFHARFEGYDGRNAQLFQGAVSILVERVLDKAFRQGQSFILDGTLTHRDKAEKNIDRCLKHDRVVQVLYVYQNPLQAWTFVQDREAEEGRRVALDTFIEQYFEARNVVNCLKKEFGGRIHVDLLLKNVDGSNRLLQVNIDQIDSYIPETYDSRTLRRILGPTQTSTP